MSLNKITAYSILIILITLFFASCGKKKSDLEEFTKFNDPAYVLKSAKDVLGNDTKFAKKGSFDDQSTIEIAAGTEVNNTDNWGIKFYLLKLKDGELTKSYETNLLNGSFNGCLVNKIKLGNYDYELIYYNSQNYFLGSGGGEIFSYIIDFSKKQNYYAHLVIGQNGPITLFFSKNTDDIPEIKNFFIALFKKDYPKLKLISNDIKLD